MFVLSRWYGYGYGYGIGSYGYGYGDRGSRAEGG